MKEIEPPFRLYDFLAYLFPGAATLHGYFILHTADTPFVLQGITTSSEVLNCGLLLIASYAIGLMWSVISRDILRRVLWRTWSNPRIEGFNGSNSAQSPFSNDMVAAVRAKAVKAFGIPSLAADQAHLLCRAYVSRNSTAAWQQRQAIVAVRGMCLNFIGPTLLYAIVFLLKGWVLLGLLCVIGAALLVRKTVELDQREWREIYFAFLIDQQTQEEPHSQQES